MVLSPRGGFTLWYDTERVFQRYIPPRSLAGQLEVGCTFGINRQDLSCVCEFHYSTQEETMGQLTVFWSEVVLLHWRRCEWPLSCLLRWKPGRRSDIPSQPQSKWQMTFPLWSLGFLLTYLDAFVGSPEMAPVARPILPISRSICGIHQRAFTLIQGSDTCLAGSSRHKESRSGWERGRLGTFFFFAEAGGGWNGRTILEINPAVERLQHLELLFHINSQAKVIGDFI